MAEKTKTVKKVTKIPEASVTIEVEQTAEAADETETTEKLEETAEVNDETQTTEEERSEEPEKKEVLSPVLGSMDEVDENSSSISWKKVFLYTFIAALIGFLILGAFFFIMKNYSLNFSQKSDKSEVATPSVSPVPTEAEVDKEAYEIEVLNGSGIAGEAASVQTILETAGFKVSGIGNADNQDFEETEISAGEDVDKAYLDELEKALGDRGETKIVDAPTSQTEDVIVTVGSNTSSNTDEEVTPTP